MSYSNSDHGANSNPGEGAAPASPLPHVESPSMAPDDRAEMQAEPANSQPANSETANSEPTKPETLDSKISILQPARSEPAARQSAPPPMATRGTALVLTLPRAEEAAAGPSPGPAGAKSRRFAFTPAAGMVAMLGAAIGSAATAGLIYLNAAVPADPMTFTASFDRINRELATLKASIDGSAKQSNSQIAKTADRMDRVEKSQADSGAKLARTADALDRLDRRLAANAPGDITGSLPTGTLGTLPAGDRTAALADPKRAAPAQPIILEGWVLRDVFNGAAMIQTPRNGILEIIPGDSLPGLGRVEGIRRQDGRWVVVTSRGLIVSR
jgi:hypothetical protein